MLFHLNSHGLRSNKSPYKKDPPQGNFVPASALGAYVVIVELYYIYPLDDVVATSIKNQCRTSGRKTMNATYCQSYRVS